MRISGGLKEDGIIVGNTYDKYASKNPIARWLMNGFDTALTDYIARVNPRTIHEIGCGEGYWTLRWAAQGLPVKGCDFSRQVISLAKQNATRRGLSASLFTELSIYDLDGRQDSADLIVCCEVLEHLENPRAGLSALQGVVENYLILSVPREPVWRVLNLARGKYIRQAGNTPGHIQHWSKRSFIELVSEYFEVVDIRSPLPWTMVLCRRLARV
ncbi:MAG TPA: class I SAM-dependent methyltransferase [Pseudomonas sp.]|jgi:2-polyprenyl-3-methyl-5-hydroxy-6-metoxy-1,4-benzoquinol methylase